MLPFCGSDDTAVRKLFALPQLLWPHEPYGNPRFFLRQMQGCTAIALALESFLMPQAIYALDFAQHFYFGGESEPVLLHVEEPAGASFPVSAEMRPGTSTLLRRYQAVLNGLPGQPTRLFVNATGQIRKNDLRDVIPGLVERATGHRLTLAEISALVDALYLRDNFEEVETIKRARGLKDREGVRERCSAFITMGVTNAAVAKIESDIEPDILNLET